MGALATGTWLTRDRIIRIAALCGLASIASIVVLLATAHGALDYQGRPLGTDFSNVWAAGGMALRGEAIDTWNAASFLKAQQAAYGSGAVGAGYIWVYPPPFLLLAALLASLPYLVALALWQAATLAPLTWMMHRLVPRWETVLLTLAAPVTLICLTHGHNGFLTALLLGGGLILLDKRPLAAGLLFGCLIYKPQFGLVLPILLVSGRHWRAIGGAALSAVAFTLVTLALWGWPVWAAFFATLPAAQHVVVELGGTGLYKVMSPLAAVRLWGGSLGLAYAAQVVVALTSIVAVARYSLRPASAELRNALVCAAALTCTPYLFDYDFVVLLPAIAFLFIDARRNGWLPWDKTLLALVWIAPLGARQVGQLTTIPLGAALPLIVFGIALRRSLRHGHPAVDVDRLAGDVPSLA